MTSRRITTKFLVKCIQALELAHSKLNALPDTNPTDYEVYRAACVKEFELVLEQGGKLLRKKIAGYCAGSSEVARLTFKDLFRYAARHDLMDIATVERWIRYRDNRNDAAHEYGEEYAETILRILPVFIDDAKYLAKLVEVVADD